MGHPHDGRYTRCRKTGGEQEADGEIVVAVHVTFWS
jgi:hypothetical protein